MEKNPEESKKNGTVYFREKINTRRPDKTLKNNIWHSEQIVEYSALAFSYYTDKGIFS